MARKFTASTRTEKDIESMKMVSEAYSKMYRSSRMSFLPRLNAFGSYECMIEMFLEQVPKDI
jgi:hypothetical protein